jgi:4-alpha-glucanotransferase
MHDEEQFMRQSGILLHPTSLPSRWGIGDLGAAAYQFVDLLLHTRQQVWQVLPLGPTGYGDSPYQCFSAFAGNPLLISPDLLLSQGLLTAEDVADYPHFVDGGVDFGNVIPAKFTLLRKSFQRFRSANSEALAEFANFCSIEASWLGNYALFMALKDKHNGQTWSSWSTPLAKRDAKALADASNELQAEVSFYAYLQFLFFRQWRAIRQYANERGITIIGDAPIFVAYDSADVWSSTELFYLDESGLPTVVAGVPPDYFSEDGQRWGNPLYRWDAHKAQGYRWWIERIRANAALYDLVRLDHFRGFAAYWEVPASEPTARVGRWVDGPGQDLFTALSNALGTLPIIAEDLGLITPDVMQLRDDNRLPGMKILQFAWHGDPTEPFLPQNYVTNCVVYTGTHDNDTSVGWYKSAPDHERVNLHAYTGLPQHAFNPAWELLRMAWASVANTAIVPLQDILSLDTDARMNYPGRLGGNWGWRFRFTDIPDHLLDRLRDYTLRYNRAPRA